MTESEARQKWCPFAGERPGTVSESAEKCIASDCMAFRWVKDATYVLGNGLVVLTDVEDNYSEESLNWDGKYARFGNQRLHRQIAEKHFGPIPDGCYVDHIDGNVLNNRRGNLRIVTPQQSGANQKSRGGKSDYRGVHKQNSGRWAAQLSSGGVRWCLGTYDTAGEAAAAYDEKAKEVHGDYSRLNLEPKTNSGRHGYCGLAGKCS